LPAAKPDTFSQHVADHYGYGDAFAMVACSASAVVLAGVGTALSRLGLGSPSPDVR
jgi:hypothetical protein